MLKANPPAEIQDIIRDMAAKAGQPVTQFLNPYITLIAKGEIKLVPQAQQAPKQA
jgi:hypothetical protein